MSEFNFESLIPYPTETVWKWFARPGAVRRLTPGGHALVVAEPSSIEVGNQTDLKIWTPTSRLLPLPQRWGAKLATAWRTVQSEVTDQVEFTEELVPHSRLPISSWQHQHRFENTTEGCLVQESIRYELKGKNAGINRQISRYIDSNLARLFSYRDRQIQGDLHFHMMHPEPKHFVIAGAGGLVGQQLEAFLTTGGHQVTLLKREPSGSAHHSLWDPAKKIIDKDVIEAADVVINLAGTPIGARFTPAHRRSVLESRVAATSVLARCLAEVAIDAKPRALINASAAGYYGPDRGDEFLLEVSDPGSGFLAEVCQAWEAETTVAADAGVRVVCLRTGIVQSAAGGQLAMLLPIFNAGFGGPIGNGRQWLPWIGLDDLVELYAYCSLNPALVGPLNACAPGIVKADDYAHILANVLSRPSALWVPPFAPALFLGRQGAQELALAGQRMSCHKTQQSGFIFRYPDLDHALLHTLAR